MKHKLVVIGYLGIKKCYLDVDVAEAVRRYRESEGTGDPEERLISTFEFNDEFAAYDAWGDTPEKVSNVGQPR